MNVKCQGKQIRCTSINVRTELRCVHLEYAYLLLCLDSTRHMGIVSLKN